jgi:hypothetical protein
MHRPGIFLSLLTIASRWKLLRRDVRVLSGSPFRRATRPFSRSILRMTYLNLSRGGIWKYIPRQGESRSAASGARGTTKAFPLTYFLCADVEATVLGRGQSSTRRSRVMTSSTMVRSNWISSESGPVICLYGLLVSSHPLNHVC